jgi:alcohol dehydrogenase class IV
VACAPDLALTQWAATVAGLAFTHTRLGIVHAMAVPLSALFGIPHGVANAVLLPYGMRFNMPAAGDLYAEVSRAMWAEGKDAAEVVRELAKSLGLETNLKSLGVDPASIPDMVAEAMKTAHVPLNPREVTADDMTALYQEAYDGEG